MIVEETLGGCVLRWSDAALELRIDVGDDGIPRLSTLAPPDFGDRTALSGDRTAPSGDRTAPSRNRTAPTGAGTAPSADGTVPSPRAQAGSDSAAETTAQPVSALPLLDVMLSSTGRQWVSQRYSESVVGSRMHYAGHEQSEDGPWSILRISLQDSLSGLAACVEYRILSGLGVLRSSVTLSNAGDAPLTILSVSSFLGSGIAGPGGELGDVDILWAENDWQAESRWQKRSFRDAIPKLSDNRGQGRSRGRLAITGVGTWSSGGHLPMGAAVNRHTGHALLWQIEHNGAWHWQVGEHIGVGPATSFVALLGPTDIEHQWSATLAPGESFESVPVSIALSAGGLEQAAASLTEYRRAVRRPHEDNRRLPVIFNDYLNTLNADPSAERLAPLIRAAAQAGAEVFCIDAGWYAEPGDWWWDAVGEWRPSATRFPDGFHRIIELIRSEGMVPGMWIEPEVIGVRSPVADSLPDEAFFMRDAERVVEQGRYQLDFRHPAARAHLDSTVDFLAGELGIEYLKLDYNINVAPGTDSGGRPAGAGMLGHNRAFLDWIEQALERHPSLTLESCASGGMRTDYATLARFQLHSTSDQEDPLLYPPIAAAAPLAVTPEQAAVWAPVQPEMNADMIAFTLSGALLGRIHLSGHINEMTVDQRELVAEAISVYKQIRGELVDALPFWPLGLPDWTAQWLALGMRGRDSTYVVIWRRDAAAPVQVSLPLAPAGTAATPRLLYPQAGAGLEWNQASGELSVSLPRAPSACLVAFDSALPAAARGATGLRGR